MWIHELCTGPSDKAPSSQGRESSVLKEQYFKSVATDLKKTLEYLEEYDLLLKFTLHEVFVWKLVDKKDLLVVSENDKEEKWFFVRVYITWIVIGTEGNTHLLVMSQNDVYLPMS